ncbi:hypothetical protein CWI38_1814p0010 [Hamiltosporidium tvaerminnensis]|uniref:Uncharacterized protein n=2 Tax=Hamiltosporidium TaxID=1176354 RepID=A0A4Q9LMD7_9MICR|nr:hypothetical protein CWI39_0066p0010 [Hamiltosporidium magnivora]TBU10370.1 hypothetical protein CWI38_1814p0010 [Hamiltosporidium tvaerminnensis]
MSLLENTFNYFHSDCVSCISINSKNLYVCTKKKLNVWNKTEKTFKTFIIPEEFIKSVSNNLHTFFLSKNCFYCLENDFLIKICDTHTFPCFWLNKNHLVLADQENLTIYTFHQFMEEEKNSVKNAIQKKSFNDENHQILNEDLSENYTDIKFIKNDINYVNLKSDLYLKNKRIFNIFNSKYGIVSCIVEYENRLYISFEDGSIFEIIETCNSPYKKLIYRHTETIISFLFYTKNTKKIMIANTLENLIKIEPKIIPKNEEKMDDNEYLVTSFNLNFNIKKIIKILDYILVYSDQECGFIFNLDFGLKEKIFCGNVKNTKIFENKLFISNEDGCVMEYKFKDI